MLFDANIGNSQHCGSDLLDNAFQYNSMPLIVTERHNTTEHRPAPLIASLCHFYALF